jgi:hypothetical protein
MNAILLDKLNDFFEEQPVDKVWLFGSYARNQETKESDVDLLVRFKDGAKITLFIYSSIVNNLEKIFNKKVDLVEETQLKDFARASAEQDKYIIYERRS